jgi:regulator of sigma E protease
MNWLLIFLGFSLLIILHEGGHYLAAKATGMRVERFFLFFGPTLWSFKRGETEYGVKAFPLGGYVKISGMNPEEELPPEVEPRAYYRQPAWKRIVVVAAGPAVNIVLAFAILTALFYSSAWERTPQVGEVRAKSPASSVLEPGDTVLAVDGRAFRHLGEQERVDRFREQIGSHRCPGKQVEGCLAATPTTLRIARDSQVRTVSVHPRYDAAEGRPLIGFGFETRPADISAGAAADRALDMMGEVVSKTASVFSRIFEEEQRKQISGIVGVSDAANQTLDRSGIDSLFLLALVSLSLGVINLLPILPLDGGHIFWAVVEKLRGRPVSLRVMERATVIGFALVMVLVVIGLTNDIGRLGSDAYEVR